MSRVLIVVTKGEIGGAQQSVFLLAHGLKKQGFEVTVATGEGNYLKEKLEAASIAHVFFSSLHRTHNILSGFRFARELHAFIKDNSIDIVHLNSSNTLIAAPFLRKQVKSVFTFRGLSVLDAGYEAPVLLKLLYRLYFQFFLSFVDAAVFVCRFNKDFAVEKGILKQGTVIYNAVDEGSLDFYGKGEAQEKIKTLFQRDLHNKFVIGSIGRLAYPKNYEFILNHFDQIRKKIPEAVFVLFGEGPERILYEKIIEEKGLQEYVYLLGESKEAKKYLKAFDLFVLPSKYEGLSITVLEALHARIPLLVSDVGGNKEILPVNCIYPTSDFQVFLQKLAAIKENSFIPPFPESISQKNLIESHIALYNDLQTKNKSQ